MKSCLVVLALIVGILLYSSLFTLPQYETAVVNRFGNLIAVYVPGSGEEVSKELKASGRFAGVKVVEGAGLHWKMPFVDDVIKYSYRLLTYDTSPQQVLANDGKKLFFDNNAQWRVRNPLFFHISMGSVRSAQTRIDDLLYSKIRERVGKQRYEDMIRNKTLVNTMLKELTAEMDRDLQPYGVQMFDIRIKRTDLPLENYESIFRRMITERERVAAQYRSEGEETSIKIKSDTDRQVTVLLAEAKAKSEELRGEGDGEAARIYNETYAADPEFFEFYNTMETYKTALTKNNTTLVLPADSPFAKYLTGVGISTVTSGTATR